MAFLFCYPYFITNGALITPYSVTKGKISKNNVQKMQLFFVNNG